MCSRDDGFDGWVCDERPWHILHIHPHRIIDIDIDVAVVDERYDHKRSAILAAEYSINEVVVDEQVQYY